MQYKRNRPNEAANYIVIAMGEVTQGETDMIIDGEHFEFRAIDIVRNQDEAIAAHELMANHLPDCKVMITHCVVSLLHQMLEMKNIEAEMRAIGGTMPEPQWHGHRYEVARDWRSTCLVEATGGIQ